MTRDERLREEPTSESDDRTIVDHGVGEPDHLQRLWTPHRMTYIAEAPMKGGSAASEQPFTDIPTLPDEDGPVEVLKGTRHDLAVCAQRDVGRS